MFTCNMAATHKTQMVLSHKNSITVSNGQQPPVTSARQLLTSFILPNNSKISRYDVDWLVYYWDLSNEFSLYRHIRLIL